MRKLVVILALAFATAPAAKAAIIGFEYLPDGEFASYSKDGATFTAVDGGNMMSQPAPNGTIGLAAWPLPLSELRADFDVYATFVSVDLGDFGGDADQIFIEAFDEYGVSLEFTTLTLSPFVKQMLTLEIEQSNIAYVIFGARDADNGSSVIADNFEFESVPEPATIVLLGLSGITLLKKRRTLR